jgi:multiple sugar transport system substrate-binding protein
VDKTLFDRFAADTGARLEDLSTWEGLYSTADKYTAWTDAQTPDVPNDGKAFFTHDYPFDYFQVGAQSLGEDFFKNGAVNFGPAMERAWDTVSGAAVRGGVWLKDGYATDPMRTGEVAASVASSASVLYYRDIVTYPDNTSENIKIITLPCPVFEGGEKLVMQRGAGFCLVKSTQEREKAACDFLRWLTEPERNTQFVTSAGYLPVTQEAFDTCLAPAVEKLTDEKYRSLYSVILQMQRDYTFYTPPQLETYIAEEDALQSGFRQTLSEARNEYVAQGGQKGGASAESLGKAAYEKLLLSMGNYAAG